MKKNEQKSRKGLKIALIVAAVVLVIGLIPFPLHMKDGGTTDYCALLYKVRSWNRMQGYTDPVTDEYVPLDNYTGVEVRIFPFNFIGDFDDPPRPTPPTTESET